MKKVAFSIPQKSTSTNAEEWVHGSTEAGREQARTVTSAVPPEPTKRFTIDVPSTLHRRIKTQCAMRGEKMADVLREILEREFPES